MKHLFSLLTLIAIFSFASVQDAAAQLTFFNGTPCPVQVYGGYTDGPNPCGVSIPTCETGWITVPPGNSVVAGPQCYSPWSGSAAFYGFKLLVSPTSGTSVELCGGSATNFIFDCGGNPRTVEIFNTGFGAIY